MYSFNLQYCLYLVLQMRLAVVVSVITILAYKQNCTLSG